MATSDKIIGIQTSTGDHSAVSVGSGISLSANAISLSATSIGGENEQNEILAQFELPATTAATVYTVPSGKIAAIRTITCSNTSGSNNTFSVYHDDAGASYTNATKIFGGLTLINGAGEFLAAENLELFVKASGTIGAQTNRASGMTVTLIGILFNDTDINAKLLYQGELSTSLVARYTVPALKTARIRQVILANTSGNVTDINTNVDKTGAVYTDANSLRFNQRMVANSTSILQEQRWLLSAGGSIGASASVASRITMSIYGDEY